MNPVVSLERVNFSYGGTEVLRDVDFELEQGDFVGIIGPNAGGKTTLLKIILGLLSPDSGTVTVLGGSARARARPRDPVARRWPWARSGREDPGLRWQETPSIGPSLESISRMSPTDRSVP